ncbi:transcriptional regulator [Thermoplasmatales archaeon SCGC AB-539-N05]|nr:transcriptional regulator [Thermoplasmatales archaeon SCGC AB-539-N05]
MTMYNIMVKIDLKDRKILYQLDSNSRQTLSQIGKKVGLPKNVVAYRINRLKELEIIKKYYTVIDSSKLGYISFRIYLTYQYTYPKLEQEILDYFIQSKYTWWIGSIEGIYDLGIHIWVKGTSEFSNFWNETLKKYRNYFEKQIITLDFQTLHCRYSYLLDEKIGRSQIETTGGGKTVQDVDNVDFNVLKVIAPDARMPITEIAKKLKTTSTVVNYRIKKLQKLEIIQGFRTNINYSKLGYQQFKVNIHLKDYSKIDQILNYILQNPNLIYIDRSAGFADLELEFHFKTLEEMHNIIKDIIVKFPGIIKNYTFFNYTKINKIQYMPQQ